MILLQPIVFIGWLLELLLVCMLPIQFSGDADPIGTRFRANPSAALAAEVNGELVGSNFMTDWGSVGVFGPLSVHPDLWNKGIAKYLLKSTMEYFTKLGTRHWVIYLGT